jgi:hypothetical protein
MCSARCSRLAAVFLVASAAYVPLVLAQDAAREFERQIYREFGFKRAIMEMALAAYKKLPPEQKTLVVGEFTGSAQGAPANGGPGIQHALIRDLARLGIQAEKEAPFEMKGDYSLVKEKPEYRNYVLRLHSRLLAQQGDEVRELPVAKWYLADLGEAASLLGMTAAPAFQGASTGKKHIDGLQWDPKNPKVYLDGTRIRSARTSPYAIEILVKAESDGPAAPVEPRLEGGLAYAPIKRDQFYEVRVYNESKYDAAVKLAIDGLDQFTFSDVRNPQTGDPLYRYLTFYKGTSYAIRGWHRTNQIADAFVVTTYAKSAAGRQLVSSAKAGTITVSFAAAWRPNERRPADEPPEVVAQDTTLGAQSGTGQGPSVATKLSASTRPEIGVIRDVITVRYTR